MDAVNGQGTAIKALQGEVVVVLIFPFFGWLLCFSGRFCIGFPLTLCAGAVSLSYQLQPTQRKSLPDGVNQHGYAGSMSSYCLEIMHQNRGCSNAF